MVRKYTRKRRSRRMIGGSQLSASVNELYNSNCLENHTNAVNFGSGSGALTEPFSQTQSGGAYADAIFGNGFVAANKPGACDAPTKALKGGRRRSKRRSRRQRGGYVQNQPLWTSKVQINHPGNQQAGYVSLDGQDYSAVAPPFRLLSTPHAASITGDLFPAGYDGVFSSQYGGKRRRRRRSKKRRRRTRRSRRSKKSRRSRRKRR